MIDVRQTLTNEEAFALYDILDEIEAKFTKRMMSGGAPNPRDVSPQAYNAFRKLTNPVRKHVQRVRSANKKRRR